ncbi:hypothetical protein FIBSPDRAFT_897584 [Athelia psychrophila]|uniref:Uncharacterized protein n=1 Tax=Athelia psychrophila TaxID=1759441 RepID=A0A166C1J2_9AGAM|nr:hypothetical protein FIBSPDRAFT_897584 [Fibularhizoctonia sp. CBS 109695]
MPKKTQPKAKPTPRPAGPKRTHEQTEKAAAIPDSDNEADEDGALVEPGDCNVDPSETDENRAVKSRKGLYRNRGTVTGMEKVFECSDDMSAFPRKADAYTLVYRVSRMWIRSTSKRRLDGHSNSVKHHLPNIFYIREMNFTSISAILVAFASIVIVSSSPVPADQCRCCPSTQGLTPGCPPRRAINPTGAYSA